MDPFGQHGSDKRSTIAGNSLHCGLNAPPMASQASVPGVASETHNML